MFMVLGRARLAPGRARGELARRGRKRNERKKRRTEEAQRRDGEERKQHDFDQARETFRVPLLLSSTIITPGLALRSFPCVLGLLLSHSSRSISGGDGVD